LRELLAMTEAHERSEWSRTASLMALIANSQRDPKRTRAFKPTDFDPFSKKRQPQKISVDVLKSVFIDGKILPELAGLQ
jgi:hypothetical protein